MLMKTWAQKWSYRRSTLVLKQHAVAYCGKVVQSPVRQRVEVGTVFLDAQPALFYSGDYCTAYRD